jgi:hypothetical protein
MVMQEVELDGFYTAEQTARALNITINNLRQIQFRKQLKWVKREGKKVFYAVADVEAYQTRHGKNKSN